MTDTYRAALTAAVDELTRGEVESLLELCADDIEVDLPANTTVPIGATLYGKVEVRRYWSDILATRREFNIDLVGVLQSERHVALFVDAFASRRSADDRHLIVIAELGPDGLCCKAGVTMFRKRPLD